MDPLVLIGSILGVALIVGANLLVGGWQPLELATPAQVVDRLRQAYLDIEPAEVVLATDRRAALVADASSRAIGLLVVRGDSVVPRLLREGDVVSASIERDRRSAGSVVSIALADFSLKQAMIRVDDAQTAQRWAARLERLRPAGDAAEQAS